MKLLSFILFITLSAAGFSWEMVALNQTDPAHPGKCVTHGLILSPGESGKPNYACLRIMCGDHGIVVTHGCGTTRTDPPCVVGQPLYPAENYPLCCEKEIICPEGVKPTGIYMT